MKIKVLSRQAMEEFKSDEKHIIISISDPNSEKVKIISKPFNILSLQFHDVDKPLVARDKCTECKGTGYLPEYKNINDGHCYRCTTMLDIKLFNNKNAQQILDFVQHNRIGIDLIVVHCEAGISRSAGVAGALSLIYNGSDQYYFDKYLPNMFVYRKILNCYMSKKNEKYKTHYFVPIKPNGSLCGVSPSWENWCRKNYCTENIKKVNCQNCLKILK